MAGEIKLSTSETQSKVKTFLSKNFEQVSKLPCYVQQIATDFKK